MRTLGWSPSITATTLFVVPKSMPTILPMELSLSEWSFRFLNYKPVSFGKGCAILFRDPTIHKCYALRHLGDEPCGAADASQMPIRQPGVRACRSGKLGKK